MMSSDADTVITRDSHASTELEQSQSRSDGDHAEEDSDEEDNAVEDNAVEDDAVENNDEEDIIDENLTALVTVGTTRFDELVQTIVSF